MRGHSLAVTAAALGVCLLAVFTWAEWHYFLDQAASHHEPRPTFWSAEHVHDWVYNAASNWQSEMLFGVLLIAVLHRLPGGERDQT